MSRGRANNNAGKGVVALFATLALILALAVVPAGLAASHGPGAYAASLAADGGHDHVHAGPCAFGRTKCMLDLDQTRALADIFGFFGTPGLVVGRTVLNGAIPCALFRRIAEDETSMAIPVC